MSQSPVSRSDQWQARLAALRALVRRTAPFAAGVLATLTALVLYNILTPKPHQITQREIDETVASAMASATPPAAYSAQVYQVIHPSLVLIQSRFPDKNGEPDGGLGSGVVIDDAGDILTALHVVNNATAIRITFADGSDSSASIIATQPENDIAVLHPDTPPANIFPATLGNPNAMNVGDEAFVVGNPFGLYGSMSSGIISGFDRSFEMPETKERIQGLIQIDAAVNPGNSGGPLLNREGQVVGIITAILNPTEDDVFIGIGFAVPITTAAQAVGLPPY
jgi:S1-C subfamily serine protease